MPISLNHPTISNSMTSMSKSSYPSLSSYSSYPRCNSYTRRSSILDSPQLIVTGSSCLTNHSSTSDVLSRFPKPRTSYGHETGSYSSSSTSSSGTLSRRTTVSDSKSSYKSELPSRYSAKYDTGRSSKLSEISPSITLSRALTKKPTITTTTQRRSILPVSAQPSDDIRVSSRERSYSSTKSNTQTTVSGRNGLRNIGNTCFLNAVVQCLSHATLLREYCQSKAYLNEINPDSDGALVKSFANLLKDLWDGENATVAPTTFKICMEKFAPFFVGAKQHDAQEFLRYLLEGLHVDVNRVRTKINDYSEVDESLSDSQKAAECWKRYLRRDDSKIVDLFVGQLKSTLKCATCGHCSTTFDPFWDLSLSIPDRIGQVRLSQCLDIFTREEVLEGNEMPTCSKCKTRRKCTKSLKIQRLPMILVLHLKRFTPIENSIRMKKILTSIDYPVDNLDLGPYTDNSSMASKFNLVGIAKHSGTAMSGHYVAICRQKDVWVEFNDHQVSVRGQNSGVHGDAYLLFYEKN